LAWIFVPKAESPSTDPFAARSSSRRDRGAQIFGMVLLAVSVSILWGGWWSPARRWILPLGLMALGAWLLFRRDEDDQPTSESPAIAVPPAASQATPTDQWSPVSSPPQDRDEVAGGRRRIIAPVVMGALLLWAGIAFLADVSVQSGLAIALCILGFGFVLGAFVGGSRALIVPAVVIAAALAATSVVDIPLSGPVGERTWAPLTSAEVADTYELSVGDGRLDLTGLRLGAGEALDLSATVGVGQLVVVVPDGVGIEISAHASAGQVVLFGRAESGLDVTTTGQRSNVGDTGTIRMRLEVGLGELEVMTTDRPLGVPSTPSTTTTIA
ncbi:MAG: hypothetical protein ACT4OV_15280, partial [Microthrixaceae bacterium]